MPPPSRKYNLNDPQRQRVYTAELFTGFPRAPEFTSMAEVRIVAKEILCSPTWEELARGTPQEGRGVLVKLGRGKRAIARSHAWRDPSILLPRKSWRRWSVFHELAHCARGTLTLNHGPQFTASYFRLIHDCWSPELAHELLAKFESNHVRVAPWAAIGLPVPPPDPNVVATSRDEGADLPTELEHRRRQIEIDEAIAVFWRSIRAGGLRAK